MFFKVPAWGMVNVSGARLAPTGPVYDNATDSWIYYVETVGGGFISDRQKGFVDELILDLKATGMWTKGDRLFILAGEVEAVQAKTSVVRPDLALASLVGTTTLKQRGYYGDWATGVFDTGFNPTTWTTPNFTATSNSFGFFVSEVWVGLSNYGAEANREGAGDGTNFNVARMFQHSGATFNTYWNNTVTIHSASIPLDQKRAFWLITRDPADPGFISLYKTGVLIERWADANPGAPNETFSIMAEHVSGAYSGFDMDPYSLVWLGGGLNPTGAADLTTCVMGYLDKWHVNSTYSAVKATEEFANPTQWGVGADGVIISDPTIVAPDGSVGRVCKYFLVVGGPHSYSHFVSHAGGTVGPGPNTVSIYVKASFWQYFGMRVYDGVEYTVWFDLVAGTVETETGAVGFITDEGNGWFRCSIAVTATAYGSFAFWLADADGSHDATGVSSNGVWIWGANHVVGLTPQPYCYIEAM